MPASFISQNLAELLLGFLWASFIAYWLVAARKSKNTKRLRRTIWGGYIARTSMVLLFVLLWSLPIFRYHLFEPSRLAETMGIILCILGLSFSVWARRSLGGNWSPNPGETKQGHQLVTAGPYKFIRHPIYSGEILALFGSFMAIGKANAFILFVALSIGVFIRSRIEDRTMAQEFPAQYPDYKKRVGALFPGIF